MLKKIFYLLVFLLSFLCASSYAAETITYYHHDALGSIVAATDESGNLLWREDYKPYGGRIRKPSGTNNNLWYTGKPEEAQLGLQYFGARWYDPNLGRFTGIDPAGVNEADIHSFNRYVYASNNPYIYVDPDGKALDTVVDAGFVVYDVGQLMGAGAAWIVGAVSGNEHLKQAAVDGLKEQAVNTAADAAAMAVPFVPAGLSRVDDAAEGVKQTRKIVIGENMARVNKRAKEIGAETFSGKTMKENEKWIRDAIEQGAEVIDIGPDFERRLAKKLGKKGGRPASKFYGMERKETTNHKNYKKEWEKRNGKFNTD